MISRKIVPRVISNDILLLQRPLTERPMVVRCHECQGNVSTTAPACPHCGAPRMFEQAVSRPIVIRDPAPRTSILRILGMLVVIIGGTVLVAWYLAPPS